MNTKEIYGIYDDDSVLLEAVKTLKKNGVNVKEAYTPFPVHGLDHALGIKYSRLPYVAFGFGALGTLTALLMQGYMLAWDWPVDIGGKPHFALPSFIPITFELTVLFASFSIVGAFLASNGLYPGKKAKLIDPRQTNDRFVLVMEVKNDLNEIENLKNLIKNTGAISIKEQENEEVAHA